MKITIRNHKTGDLATIHRDVTTTHPQWVHDQLGTKSETDLQHCLDQLHVSDYYDQETGKPLGRDDAGLNIRYDHHYRIRMQCSEDGSDKVEDIACDTLDEAKAVARVIAGQWAEDGDWGNDGARLPVDWELYDADGSAYDDPLVTDTEVVEIEPNHEAKIREAAGYEDICGDDPDDHDWTNEGEGGLDDNPGVWAPGGTTIVTAYHCRKCGLHQTNRYTGSQYNPGDHDTVEYRMLDEDEIEQHRENGTMDEEAEAVQ